jgi:hypothetical protein
VSQVGARAHLVGIQGMDRKGKIEQVYAMNGDSTSDAKQSTPAVFVNGGRSVVFHSRESSCLVWNKMKGEVLSGLDHGDSESIVIVARLLADIIASDVDEQTQAVAVSILNFLLRIVILNCVIGL